MGVAKLKKLLIVSHKSEQEAVLNKLQDASLVELKPYTEKLEQADTLTGISDQPISEVKKTLDILDRYKGKKKPGEKAGKLVLNRTEYEKILSEVNFEQVMRDVESTEEELNIVNSEIANMGQQINTLKQWSAYSGDLESIGAFEHYTVRLIRIRCRERDLDALIKDMEKSHISAQNLGCVKEEATLILAYHNTFKKQAESHLGNSGFEEAELSGYKGTIQKNIDRLSKSLSMHQERKQKLIASIREFRKEYETRLTVYLDYLENNQDIENAINFGFSTDSVSFYTAWVDQQYQSKVYDILYPFSATRIMEIEPAEGEVIPTALKNKALFRPFEVIINLYGVPRYFEIDPTSLVAIFFALFFGLCLTDAGYGIILAALALIFAFKMKQARKFLMLIFYGGLFTILAGTLFNGWFGDLPSYLGFGKTTLNWALLGDPVNSTSGAMNFFRLALLLGVIQIVFGLFIKFFDSLRSKDWGAAFFDTLPWILIVVSLVILLLSTQMAVDMQLVEQPLFSSSIGRYLIWLIIPSALIIIVFSARDEKSWGFRLFMGFLNLTIVNGLTSYLGDSLSYIRLMALGLVTAGIGVAINEIAFQLATIPVVGIAITIVALIFGHAFNIGINVLGGFVHTLRLQYVEFFPKFYRGGGRPIEILQNNNKYISIVDK